MPGFRYQAYNVEGRLHKGVLEADSARQARATLRDQGLTPHRVELIAANDPAGGARFGRISLSTSELTQLTRGLAKWHDLVLRVQNNLKHNKGL
jgi:general secretion pathway protein F